MDIQLKKINRFSKVICTLLSVAIIILIIAAVLEAVAWLWNALSLNTETVTIGGINYEAPLLFKVGDVKVYLPIVWQKGFEFSSFFTDIEIGISDMLGTIFTIAGLIFARQVFRLLRDNGSPFRDDVVQALKRFVIALLLMAVVSGVVPLLAAGVVWVLCMIFDYGCTLQRESDTTL